MKTNGIDFKPDIEIVSYALVTEFIKAGFGSGYITKEFAKEELERGELYEIKVKPNIEERTWNSYIKKQYIKLCSEQACRNNIKIC